MSCKHRNAQATDDHTVMYCSGCQQTFEPSTRRSKAPAPRNVAQELADAANVRFTAEVIAERPEHAGKAGVIKTAVNYQWVRLEGIKTRSMTDAHFLRKVAWLEGEIRGLRVAGLPSWLARKL